MSDAVATVRDVTSTSALPAWLAFSGALLAAVVALVVGLLNRTIGLRSVRAADASAEAARQAARNARAASDQLDVWRKREETYRTLRWAADHAIEPDPKCALIGVRAIRALQHGGLLQPSDEGFVLAVMAAVTEGANAHEE